VQGKSREGKAWLGKARKGVSRQFNEGQGKARKGKVIPDKAKRG
jgi:hypothetical protein